MKGISTETVNKLLNKRCQFEIDGVTALSVIAQIQLASRHPKNNGEAISIAIQFAIDLQNQLRGIDETLDMIIEMGWNLEYDI